MGTRSGDIDAGVVSYLCATAQMSVDEIESMLNHRSGVLAWPVNATSAGYAG